MQRHLQISPPAGDDLMRALALTLRRLRMRRGLSLERLAGASGVSKSMLGAIELARSVPTITVLHKIARGLGVSLASLLEIDIATRTSIVRSHEARVVHRGGSALEVRALFHPDGRSSTEVYELRLPPLCSEVGEQRAPGLEAHLVIAEGSVRIEVRGNEHELSRGDAISFDAETPHAYHNTDEKQAILYLFITSALKP